MITPERIIELLEEEAIGQCGRCAEYGPPLQIDEDGVCWHRYMLRDKETIGECDSSALWRVVKAIDDETSEQEEM